jgi:hypothetical protein
MQATLRLILLLAVATSLSTSARSQDTLDDVKRRLKVEVDKVEADFRDGLNQAEQQARKSLKDAIEELKYVDVKLGAQRVLPPERRAELQKLVNARIGYYQAMRARGDTRYDAEERARLVLEQQKRFEQKKAEMRHARNRIAQLYKEGTWQAAAELEHRFRQLYGPSFASAIKSFAETKETLATLQAIKDERDERFRRSMQQLIRDTLPLTSDSGVEFPPDWPEKTKKRTQVKLTPEEDKLLKALSAQITMDEKDVPLQGLLDRFEKQYGIKIEVNKDASEQLMINLETTPVSIRARGTSLRTVLKQALGDARLTYVIADGKVQVMTPEQAGNLMSRRVYYVGDLVDTLGFADPFGVGQLNAVRGLLALTQLIKSIEPQSWVEGGGKGTIQFNLSTMSLVISQSAEMHYTLRGSLPR